MICSSGSGNLLDFVDLVGTCKEEKSKYVRVLGNPIGIELV